MSSATGLPFFGFNYGEDTKLSVTVKAVHFNVYTVPQQGRALVETLLTVVNDKYHKAVEGSLRFPLPHDAAVVRYAFQTGDHLVDAISLPNKKAAEVAYKEKEAGRSVSKTTKVQGNLFEVCIFCCASDHQTSIFPLEFNVEKQLVISYSTPLVATSDSEWEVGASFSFQNPVKLSAQTYVYPLEAYESQQNLDATQLHSTLSEGLKVKIARKNKTSRVLPELCFGSYLGQTHFSAFIDRAFVLDVFGDGGQTTPDPNSAPQEKQICVLWDVSQSQRKKTMNLNFFSDLEEEHKKRNETVAFTIYTFSTEIKRLGSQLSASDAQSFLNLVNYDGGTNLSVIGEIFKNQLLKKEFDYFVVFTDGIDNLGDIRLPDGISPEIGVPINVLVPEGVVHESLLRCIASQTRGHYGSLSLNSAACIAGNSEDLIITNVMPVVLGSTDSEAVLIDLFNDENFSTVPDWRLPDKSWWPLRDAGSSISGTLPSNLKGSPTALEITFFSTTRGKKTARIPFAEPNSPLPVHEGEIGRLIGITHALNVIEESRVLVFQPEFSKNFITDVAMKYNIPSEHTSLLLLHSAEQFIDNKIECPASHPAHKQWLEMKKKLDLTQELAQVKEEIKKMQKIQNFILLASRLVGYANEGLAKEPVSSLPLWCSIVQELKSTWENSPLADSLPAIKAKVEHEIQIINHEFEDKKKRVASGNEKELAELTALYYSTVDQLNFVLATAEGLIARDSKIFNTFAKKFSEALAEKEKTCEITDSGKKVKEFKLKTDRQRQHDEEKEAIKRTLQELEARRNGLHRQERLLQARMDYQSRSTPTKMMGSGTTHEGESLPEAKVATNTDPSERERAELTEMACYLEEERRDSSITMRERIESRKRELAEKKAQRESEEMARYACEERESATQQQQMMERIAARKRELAEKKAREEEEAMAKYMQEEREAESASRMMALRIAERRRELELKREREAEEIRQQVEEEQVRRQGQNPDSAYQEEGRIPEAAQKAMQARIEQRRREVAERKAREEEAQMQAYAEEERLQATRQAEQVRERRDLEDMQRAEEEREQMARYAEEERKAEEAAREMARRIAERKRELQEKQRLEDERMEAEERKAAEEELSKERKKQELEDQIIQKFGVVKRFEMVVHDVVTKVDKLTELLVDITAKLEKPEKLYQPKLSKSEERLIMLDSIIEKIIATEKGNTQAKKPFQRNPASPLSLDEQIQAAAVGQDYLQSIKGKLLEGDVQGAYSEYLKERENNNNADSPSFYIYSSRLFWAADCPASICTKIITNTLELKIEDVQMFRSVAYFMLEIGATKEAILLFRRIQDLAPGEPHSHLDLGMAIYFDVRLQCKDSSATREALGVQFEKELKESTSHLATVLLEEWPPRFNEIEWPTTVWLNWITEFGLYLGIDVWPCKISKGYRVAEIRFDIVVALGWDTDNTDIDLHVREPNGNEVYYSNANSSIGGHLSKDFREGYGPECYLLRHAIPGKYKIEAHYFSSSQASSHTGTTSCVVWSVKNLGSFDIEEIVFKMVRLKTNSSSVHVMDVHI